VSLTTDDLLISGSNKLSLTLLGQMRGYRLGDLVPYDPAFLAGLHAQAYEVDLETAWEQARKLMRARTKDACQKQASAQRMRNFSMNLDFSDESWRYILLPLYLATYRYGDKVFQVMINGQTGLIAGQRPVDWKKVGWTLAGAFLPVLLLALTAVILLANAYDIGGLFGLLAGVGLIVWLVFVIDTLRKAGKMTAA